MSNRLFSALRIFGIQLILTLILGLSAQYAQAKVSVITTIPIKEHINSYLYEGEKIDLLAELDLSPEQMKQDQLKNLQIKAQGIEYNAKLTLVVNGKRFEQHPLKNKMKTLNIKLGKNISLQKLELESKGAFIRLAKANLVSAEPPTEAF